MYHNLSFRHTVTRVVSYLTPTPTPLPSQIIKLDTKAYDKTIHQSIRGKSVSRIKQQEYT